MVFDIEAMGITMPKLVKCSPQGEFIPGTLQFEFLSAVPTADEHSATVAVLVVPCIIPRIHAKVDSMIKDRYLSGVVSTWSNTCARQALMGLEPPGPNGQRLLKKRPTVFTRGMSYSDAQRTYADGHTAGTLSDADYVEWITMVRNHM